MVLPPLPTATTFASRKRIPLSSAGPRVEDHRTVKCAFLVEVHPVTVDLQETAGRRRATAGSNLTPGRSQTAVWSPTRRREMHRVTVARRQTLHRTAASTTARSQN